MSELISIFVKVGQENEEIKFPVGTAVSVVEAIIRSSCVLVGGSLELGGGVFIDENIRVEPEKTYRFVGARQG